jgi:hypothetical protein
MMLCQNFRIFTDTNATFLFEKVWFMILTATVTHKRILYACKDSSGGGLTQKENTCKE